MPRNGGTSSSRKRPGDDSEAAIGDSHNDGDDDDSRDQDKEEESVGGSDEEMEEASDDGSGSDNDDGNDDEEMPEPEPEPMGSPSPAKKDMKLRSGRRKRRRSKETTGLTPPEQQKAPKKARATPASTTATERKTKGRKSTVADTTPAAAAAAASPRTASIAANGDEDRSTTTATKSKTAAAKPPRASTRGRASILSTDPEALARAQDPEVVGSPLVPPDAESSRRLFDGKPPSSSPDGAVAPPAELVAITETAPTHSEPLVEAPKESFTTTTANGHHQPASVNEKVPSSPILSSGVFWRIFFMLFLTMPLHMIAWPVCVSVSDYIIPLKELTISEEDLLLNVSLTSDGGEEEIVVDGQGEEDPAMLEPPTSFVQSLQSMNRVQQRTTQKLEMLQRSRHLLRDAVDELVLLLKEKKGILERSAHLNQVETLLLAALQEENALDSAVWQQVRESVEGLGRTILDTPSIELWQVEIPEGCTAEALAAGEAGSSLSVDTAGDDDSNNPVVDPKEFKKITRTLTERCAITANNLKDSSEAQELVREWIKEQLDNHLEGDQQAAAAIEGLTRAAEETQHISSGGIEAETEHMGGLSSEAIEEIVEDRLEMELADRTGEFDHAAIFNGAAIIRQGNWATSKSLVDTLPLGNRLLQLSQLQFYGFGPEVAITPTYPTDALGQCWSFQETSVTELLERRRSLSNNNGNQDHTTGNFGTISVNLPAPVRVRSVVIEHPPQGLTDQIDSAIRAFRVIGFEDAEATTRSWSLGSFEYDIKSPNSLQEFEVAEEMFDRVVPPLHSISLAIDSNWGYDYACLYRFRVHGDEVEIEEIR